MVVGEQWRGILVGAVALVGWPGDDVGAMVRARAGILAEVELERLNLQHRGWKKKVEGRKSRQGRARGRKTEKLERKKVGRGNR